MRQKYENVVKGCMMVVVLSIFFLPHASAGKVSRKKYKDKIANEFYFMLGPSRLHGVGVFAVRDIPKNTRLMVTPAQYKTRIMHKNDIPDMFTRYCTAIEENMYRCPKHFNMMPLECYWNHSTMPNVQMRLDGYYAIEDIRAGQEILFNYHELGEPEEMKETFYDDAD